MNWCIYSWIPGGNPPNVCCGPPKFGNPWFCPDPGIGGFDPPLNVGEVFRERDRGLTYAPAELLPLFNPCRSSAPSLECGPCAKGFLSGDSANEAGLDPCVVGLPGGIFGGAIPIGPIGPAGGEPPPKPGG